MVTLYVEGDAGDQPDVTHATLDFSHQPRYIEGKKRHLKEQSA